MCAKLTAQARESVCVPKHHTVWLEILPFQIFGNFASKQKRQINIVGIQIGSMEDGLCHNINIAPSS